MVFMVNTKHNLIITFSDEEDKSENGEKGLEWGVRFYDPLAAATIVWIKNLIYGILYIIWVKLNGF